MRAGMILALLTVALLVAGCGAEGSAGPSQPPSDDRVSMVVIGDFGVGRTRQRRLGAAVKAFASRQPVDVLVTVGDNDYASQVSSFVTNWTQSFGWLEQEKIPVAGALGNHDVENRAPSYQFRLLGMPSRYYARSVGNVRLVVLDSNALGADQRGFLQRELANAGHRWPIVVFHHPPYTCGAYAGETAGAESVLPDLQRGGARLVLTGHDHNYQRFGGPDGEAYVVAGWGGADLYRLGRCSSDDVPRLAANDTDFGFLFLEAGTREIHGTAITVDGRVVDRFSVRR